MIEKLVNRKWKVLSSKYIIKRDEWLTVRQEEVQLPNGITIPSWYILEFPNWINVIAITKNNQFLLIDQYRHALGTTNYELVAGVVEKNETPLHAAQRELLEETGYGKGTWSLFTTLSPNPTNHNNLSYTFLAIGVEEFAAAKPEPTEDIKTHLVTKQELIKLLQTNQIIQALHVAPLYKYLFQTETNFNLSIKN